MRWATSCANIRSSACDSCMSACDWRWPRAGCTGRTTHTCTDSNSPAVVRPAETSATNCRSSSPRLTGVTGRAIDSTTTPPETVSDRARPSVSRVSRLARLGPLGVTHHAWPAVALALERILLAHARSRPGHPARPALSGSWASWPVTRRCPHRPLRRLLRNASAPRGRSTARRLGCLVRLGGPHHRR